MKSFMATWWPSRPQRAPRPCCTATSCEVQMYSKRHLLNAFIRLHRKRKQRTCDTQCNENQQQYHTCCLSLIAFPTHAAYNYSPPPTRAASRSGSQSQNMRPHRRNQHGQKKACATQNTTHIHICNSCRKHARVDHLLSHFLFGHHIRRPQFRV